MSSCSSCGQPIPADAQFCNSCGAKQDGAPQIKAPASEASHQVGAPSQPAKKRLGPLAWVGIGCGGLVILGVIIFAVFAVIGYNTQKIGTGNTGAGAATQAETGDTGAGAAVAPRQMSAVDLYNEYTQNPQQALQKYRGQRIRFTGALTEKPHPAVANENKKNLALWTDALQNGRVMDTTIYITLNTGRNTGRVVAAFKANNTVQQIVSSGQYKSITFDGVVDGIKNGGQSGNFILLTDCSLVN